METLTRDTLFAALDAERESVQRETLVARAESYFRRRHPDATQRDIDWATSMVQSLVTGPDRADNLVRQELARYIRKVIRRVGGAPRSESESGDRGAIQIDRTTLGKVVLDLIDGVAF